MAQTNKPLAILRTTLQTMADAQPRRIPHDIFRHILGFKDPRYEYVRNGGEAPTCVWRPWSRRFEETTYYNVRFGNYIEEEYPFFDVYGPNDEHRRFNGARAVERLEEDRMDNYSDLTYCPLVQISMQCEACGPDLELYQMLRR